MRPFIGNPCDHDFPERDGRCVGCGDAVSGDAKTIEELLSVLAAVIERAQVDDPLSVIALARVAIAKSVPA